VPLGKHAGNVERFHPDDPVLAGDRGGQLVRVLAAKVGNALVQALDPRLVTPLSLRAAPTLGAWLETPV
jgi:hypothetical protein